MSENNIGIYVHIPFCVKKCIYCDFCSFSDTDEKVKSVYFETLMREARSLSGYMKKNGITADTAFIGGGTPSSVDYAYITDILKEISAGRMAEVSVEVNPGTVTGDMLEAYVNAGVTRLSIGAQSFDDSELKFLGRIHSASQTEEAFRMAREAGIANINIDLIFGFPGQSIESWKESLQRTIKLVPEHISFYSLQIEEGTRLYDLFRSEKIAAVSDELNRGMYHCAHEMLRAHGYHHYEISNAAQPGFECAHNLKYWRMEPYIGIGLAAHSCLNNSRFSNPEDLGDYEMYMDHIGVDDDFMLGRDVQESSDQDYISDFFFTGLRLTDGISISRFEEKTGINFREKYRDVLYKHLKDGLLAVEADKLRFTEKGLDVANSVIIDFI